MTVWGLDGRMTVWGLDGRMTGWGLDGRMLRRVGRRRVHAAQRELLQGSGFRVWASTAMRPSKPSTVMRHASIVSRSLNDGRMTDAVCQVGCRRVHAAHRELLHGVGLGCKTAARNDGHMAHDGLDFRWTHAGLGCRWMHDG